MVMKTARSCDRTGIVLLVILSSTPASAQEKLTRVRIAYPSGGICCLALYGGIQWKIFEENGLHVEIVQIRSQIGNMALMANEIQYFSGVGPASVSATLRGMPSRGVWFASDQLIYSLMARPEMSILRDLRGKKIGITGLGGTSHVALQIALEAAGENPKNFVYVVLGRRSSCRRWRPARSTRRYSARRSISMPRRKNSAKCSTSAQK